MERRNIILNYTIAPTLDDFSDLAGLVLENLPDELTSLCDELTISIEDVVEDIVLDDLGLEDSFELLALYKSGKEISPGIEKKVSSEDDILLLYRRPILDMWCETGEDLHGLIYQVVVEEIGRYFDLSEDEINNVNEKYYA